MMCLHSGRLSPKTNTYIYINKYIRNKLKTEVYFPKISFIKLRDHSVLLRLDSVPEGLNGKIFH